MLRGKWVLFGGVTILLAAAAGALQVYRQRVTHRPVAAAVVTQAAGPVASEVSLAGVIDAQSVVKVAAPIEGIVESFGAEAGEDVFEGQLIAHIKNTRLDSAVEAAQLETDRLQARVHELEAAIVAARLEMSRSVNLPSVVLAGVLGAALAEAAAGVTLAPSAGTLADC